MGEEDSVETFIMLRADVKLRMRLQSEIINLQEPLLVVIDEKIQKSLRAC